jgi:hypothetical protein
VDWRSTSPGLEGDPEIREVLAGVKGAVLVGTPLGGSDDRRKEW